MGSRACRTFPQFTVRSLVLSLKKMAPVADVAEFIFQCVARLVVLFRGTLPQREIVRKADGSAVINLTVRLPKMRNFQLGHWVSGALQVLDLVQNGTWRDVSEPAPGTLEAFPPPHPYRRARCVLCGEAVDPVTLWSLRCSWPLRKDICVACFGPKEGHLNGASDRSNGTSKAKVLGRIPIRSPSPEDRVAERRGSRERSCSIEQSAGVASEMGLSQNFASDVLRVQSAKELQTTGITRGRNYKKNARRRQRIKALRRAVRIHGLRLEPAPEQCTAAITAGTSASSHVLAGNASVPGPSSRTTPSGEPTREECSIATMDEDLDYGSPGSIEQVLKEFGC